MLVQKRTNTIYPARKAFLPHLGDGMRRVFTELLILNERVALRSDDLSGFLVDAWAFQRLPKSVTLRLDESFTENLLASHLLLAFKTFTPAPATLSCLAEEMLLVWSTEWILHPPGAKSLSQEVDDFLNIVIGSSGYPYNGLPVGANNHLNQNAYSVPFGLEHWFTSYENPLAVTHPFTWPDDKSS